MRLKTIYAPKPKSLELKKIKFIKPAFQKQWRQRHFSFVCLVIIVQKYLRILSV